MTLPAALDWSPGQLAAIDRVRAWLADPFGGGSREPGVFRFFGFAGAGKTTLARHLAAEIAGRVVYAAFTGKAAHVMRRKGCVGASTIHRLIYVPKNRCKAHLRDLQERLERETDEDRRRELRVELDAEAENAHRPSFALNLGSELRDAALLILDECSMVGEQVGRDLLSFEVPILALGDPAQLPPVKDRGYFTDPRQEPDLMLSEVHRQAEGSAVLRLCDLARSGAAIPRGDHGEGCRVIAPGELALADALAQHDQIIVGRNETRKKINARAREALGLGGGSPDPVPGDRLVCLRNDHEVGLLNGGQWICTAVQMLDEGRALLTIDPDDGDDEAGGAITVEAHLDYFRGGSPRPWAIREAQCFDYAYAITAHKSQGSGWPRVCVLDESGAFGADARRWIYTAISRASERVTVIR